MLYSKKEESVTPGHAAQANAHPTFIISDFTDGINHMENLRPIQRIAVIAICLAMTAVLALWLLPWGSEQLEARLEDMADSNEQTESTPTPTPVSSIDTQPSGIQLGNTSTL